MKKIIIDAAQETCCPKCSHTFALSEGVSRQTVERFAEDFRKELTERHSALEAEVTAVAREHARQEAAKEIAALNALVEAARAEAAASKSAIENARTEAAAAATEQLSTEITALRQALQAKDASVASLRDGELELRRQLRESEGKRENQELEYQRRLD